MSKLLSQLIALTLLAISMASAGAVVLTFELPEGSAGTALGEGEKVLNFYNGGPGGSLGITFSPEALAVIEGESNNIANPTSRPTAIFFEEINDPESNQTGFITIDVLGGFASVSFYYSQSGTPLLGFFRVFDGTALVASGNLPDSTSGCSSTKPLCQWTNVTVPFPGTATSLILGGAPNFIAFDNIAFGVEGNGAVPEPGVLSLLALALTGLGLMRGRRLS